MAGVGHELATAYVAVVPSMAGVTAQIGKEMEGVAKGLSKQVDFIPKKFDSAFGAAAKAVSKSIDGITGTTAKMLLGVTGSVSSTATSFGKIVSGADDAKTSIGKISHTVKDTFETAAIKGMYAGDKIKDGFETARIAGMYAGDKIKGVLETIAVKGMYAADFIRTKFSKVATIAVAGFQKIQTGALVVGRVVRTGLTKSVSAVATGFRNLGSAAESAFPQVFAGVNKVRGGVKKASNSVKGFVDGVRGINASVYTFTGAAERMGMRFRDGFLDANAAASTFTGRMGTLGGKVRKALMPIESASKWIVDSFETLALKGMMASDKIKEKFLDLAGPVMLKVKKGFSAFSEMFPGLQKKVKDGFVGVVSKVTGSLITATGKGIGIFGKFSAKVLTGGAKLVKGAVGAATSAVKKMGETLKGPATAIFISAMGGIAIAMKKGLGRLNTIDTARAKMRGLGIEGTKAASIMNSAESSVLGTIYGLDEAATAAQGAVAAGVKSGKELDSVMKTMVNTASAANRPLDEISQIFNSVAGTQQAYTSQINQIARSGIPMWKNLAKVMNMSQAEVRAAVRAGEVGFEEFTAAAELSAGKIADEMGKTLPGALKNLGASVSRLGANIWKGFEPEDGVYTGLYNKLAPLVISLTEAMKPLEKVAAQVGETIGEKLAPAIDWVTEKLEDIKAATEKFVKPADDLVRVGKDASDNFSGLFDVLKPFGAMFLALGAGGVGPLLQVFGRFRPLLGPIPAVLGAIGSSAGIAVAGLVTLAKVDPSRLREGFNKIVESLPKLINDLVIKFGKFGREIIPSFVEGITANLPILLNGIQRIITTVAETFANKSTYLTNTMDILMKSIMGSLEKLLPHIVTFIETAIPEFMNVILSMAPQLLSAAIQLFEGLVIAVRAIFPALVNMLIVVIADIVTMIVEFGPDLLSAAIDLFVSLVDAVVDIINPLLDAVTGLLPVIVDAIISMLPDVLEAGIDLFSKFMDALARVVPSLIESLMGLLPKIVSAVVKLTPKLLNAAITLFMKLVDAVIKVTPSLVMELVNMLPPIIQALVDMIPALLEGMLTLLNALVEAIPIILPPLIEALITLIMDIINSLVEMVPTLLDGAIMLFGALAEAIQFILPELLTAIVDLLPVIIESLMTMLPDLLAAAIDLFIAIVHALPLIVDDLMAAILGLLPMLVETLVAMIPDLVVAAVQLFMGIVAATIEVLPNIIAAVLELIISVISTIGSMAFQLFTTAVELFMQLVLSIPSVAVKLWNKIKEFGGEMVQKFLDLGPKMLEAGKELIGGLVNGVKEKATAAVDAVKDVGKNIVGGFKNFLGINSPSKVFSDIGEALTEGLKGGVEGGSGKAVEAVGSMGKSIMDPVKSISTAFSQMTQVVSAQVRTVASLMQQLVNVSGRTLTGGFAKAIKAVGTMFRRDLPKSILDSVKAMTKSLTVFTKWVSSNLVSGIGKAMKNVQASFSKILGPISTSMTRLRTLMGQFQTWMQRTFQVGMGKILASLQAAFKKLPTSISSQLTLSKNSMSTFEGWTRNTFQKRLVSAVDAIKSAFKKVPTDVATAWSKMRSATAVPTNFVISSVYMNGIRSAVNAISKAVGVSMSMPAVSSVSYASGTAAAVLPGYSPGVDNYTFYNPKLGFLRLGGGEAILRPEVTKALGGAPTINSWNQSRGRGIGKVGDRGYASGGIIDFLRKGSSGGWDVNTKGKDFQFKVLDNPGKAVQSLVVDPTRSSVRGIGGGEYGHKTGLAMVRAAEKIPAVFAKKANSISGGGKGIVAAARKALGVPYVWGGSSVPPGLDCSGLVYWSLMRMGKKAPRLTAAGYQAAAAGVSQPRAGDLAFWGNPAYHVAIMTGPGRMIHAPMPGRSVSEAPIYGAPSYGRLRYDQGGYLMPGLNVVENKTGKPEPVLTSEQWDAMMGQNKLPAKIELVLEDGRAFPAYVRETVGAKGNPRSILGAGEVGF